MEHFKHSSMLMDGAVSPKKVMKFHCGNCGHQDNPKKFNPSRWFRLFFSNRYFSCPNCGKRDSLSKVLNDFGKVAIKVRPKWHFIMKPLAVLLIFELMHLGSDYFEAEQEKEILANPKTAEEFVKNNSAQKVAEFIEDIVHSVETDEEKFELLLGAGYIYLKEENFQRAIWEFEAAKKYTVEESAEEHLLLGEIALADGKLKQALHHFIVAHDRDPNNVYVNNSLGDLYLGLDEETEPYTDYDKALKHLKFVYESDDKLQDAASNLGVAYFKLGEYDKAVNLFLEDSPNDDPYLNLWIGMSYFKSGDQEKGEFYIGKTRESNKLTDKEIQATLTAYGIPLRH